MSVLYYICIMSVISQQMLVQKASAKAKKKSVLLTTSTRKMIEQPMNSTNCPGQNNTYSYKYSFITIVYKWEHLLSQRYEKLGS